MKLKEHSFFFWTVIIYTTVLTKTVYASLVWHDCIQNSHSIQGNAHPHRRQHISSPITLDLKKSEFGLTHFNFIPMVFILLQDPCSVKRSWWHWHWSLRTKKNTKRSSENNTGEVISCSSLCMKGIKLALMSSNGPHYSCFQSLHKWTLVCRTKELHSPYTI